MKDLKRPSQNKFLYSPITLVVLFVLVILLAISLMKMVGKSRQTREVRDQYRDEITALEKQQEELASDIDYLSTERGMEEEIRDRFPVVKEGEDLILIIDEEDDEFPLEVKEGGFFKRLFN